MSVEREPLINNNNNSSPITNYDGDGNNSPTRVRYRPDITTPLTNTVPNFETLDPFLNPIDYHHSYVPIQATHTTLLPNPKGHGASNAHYSVNLMIFINFVSSTCFSIVLPSLFNYLTHHFQEPIYMIGWAISLHSAGGFLGSPLMSFWYSRRTAREVLLFSLFLIIAGNILYSMAVKSYMILLGRLLVGLGSANYTITQQYLDCATLPSDKQKIMAYNSSANILGFIFGPYVTVAISFIPSITILSNIKIDQNTLPGYAAALLSLGTLISIFFIRELPLSMRNTNTQHIPHNHHAQQAHTQTHSGNININNNSANSNHINTIPIASSSPSPQSHHTHSIRPLTSSSYQYAGSGYYGIGGSIQDVSNIIGWSLKKKESPIPALPIFLSLLFYFSLTSAFTVWETVGAAYTAKEYNWVILNNGLMFGGMGISCIVALMLLNFIIRGINERYILIVCFAFCTAGFGIMMNWKGPPPESRLLISVIMSSIGYAMSVALLISVYSKIILVTTETPMLMGWLITSGTIARISGPIMSSYTLQYGGENILWLIPTLILVISTILAFIFHKKLAPSQGVFNETVGEGVWQHR